MGDIYKNIEEYNSIKKREILIAFYDIVTDMISNEKLNPLATELFIIGRMLNIYLVFIKKFYFAVSKILN